MFVLTGPARRCKPQAAAISADPCVRSKLPTYNKVDKDSLYLEEIERNNTLNNPLVRVSAVDPTKSSKKLLLAGGQIYTYLFLTCVFYLFYIESSSYGYVRGTHQPCFLHLQDVQNFSILFRAVKYFLI